MGDGLFRYNEPGEESLDVTPICILKDRTVSTFRIPGTRYRIQKIETLCEIEGRSSGLVVLTPVQVEQSLAQVHQPIGLSIRADAQTATARGVTEQFLVFVADFPGQATHD
nr:hypothetical protein [Mesorhizobium neociceri]